MITNTGHPGNLVFRVDGENIIPNPEDPQGLLSTPSPTMNGADVHFSTLDGLIYTWSQLNSNSE